ncbi:MAG: Hsp20/alpha crystallin family protein [Bacteroidia bacterium]|nr:Hsp20/alpha crystallin family protein [Bacteroidia bacterium]
MTNSKLQPSKNFWGSFISPTFEDFFQELQSGISERSFVPRTDIVETEDDYQIHVEAPGIAKDAFKVDVADGKLTVRGERQFEKSESGKTWHRVERSYGNFSRSFFLPKNIKKEAIQATYTDGILKLVIPKDNSKPNAVSIEVS